jgi:hypothetical protein
MRSLWLASAALIVTSGVAFAQTTSPPPMSPGMSNQGTMSPMQPSAGHDQANQYLWQARTAIQQHRGAKADTLLSHAETIILTRAVPQTTGPARDNSDRVTAIENARTAVKQRNWSAAAQYTDSAIHHHAMMNGPTPGGMNNGGMNNGGMGQGTMAPPSGTMAPPNRTVQ